MKRFLMALTFIACGLCSANSQAGVIALAEYAFNVNGTVTNGSAPAGVNLGAFNTTTGLGTITATFTSPGTHYFGVFLDHELDETINTFFNEYGVKSDDPILPGLSWETDEPGFVFGDIYDNFALSSLDNSIGVLSGSPDDVSMALAWNFTLGADEAATIQFLVSETAPSGFYIGQVDPDSGSRIYFSTNLNISPTGGGVVPEPSSLLIFLGLLGTTMRRHRMQ